MRTSLLFAVFFCFSCGQSRETGPPLSEEQLVNGLVNLHLAEAATALQWSKPAYQDRKDLEFHILSENNIDTADFRQTLHWYADRPDRMEKVYDLVEEKISQLNPDAS